jgi:hypothetical protein
VENASLGDVVANGSRLFMIHRVLATQYATQFTPAEMRTLILDSDAHEIAHGALPAGVTGYEIDAAAVGSGFVAVWNRNTPPNVFVEAMRFDENGAPLSTQPRVIAAAGESPVVASDGTDVVILALGGSGQWSSYLVSNNLSTISPPMVVSSGTFLMDPSILWNGDRYVVYARSIVPSASEYRPMLFQLDRSGKTVASATVTLIRSLSTPGPISAVSRGGDVLLTWTENVLLNDSHQTNVAAAGSVVSAATLQQKSSPRYLIEAVNNQQAPAAASGAGMTVIAWRESDGLYATRFRNQRSLDGRGIKLRSYDGGLPQVVFDGKQFVIGWNYGASVQFRFISPESGLLADVETLQTSTIPTSFGLASGGGRTIVAWKNNGRIEVSSLDAATRLLGPSTPVSPAGETSDSPVAAWNGSEFLVAWDQYEVRSLAVGPLDDVFHLRVKGARLSADLALRDPQPLLIGDVDPGRDEVKSIASNGNDWLVTWVSDGESYFGRDGSIRARRVRRDGSLDATPEGTFITKGYNSRVAWDGTRYAVSWVASDNHSIVLAYLLPGDGIVTGPPITIVAPQLPIGEYALTSPSLLKLDVTYSRFASEAAYGGAWHVFMRSSMGVTKIRAVR